MKHIIFTLILLQFLLSCNDSVEQNSSAVQIKDETSRFPVIKDTFHYEGRYKSVDEYSISNYRPIYIGIDSSPIYVDYQIQKYYYEPSTISEIGVNNTKEQEVENKYWAKYGDFFSQTPSDELPFWDSVEIKIFIDTSQLVKNIGRFKREGEEFLYNSYPVLIKNETNQSVIAGYGSHIPLTLEAKNETGKWITLEYAYLYSCGNELPYIVLPPNNIMISSLPISTGNKKTELRLKLGENYSNVIWGNLTIDDTTNQNQEIKEDVVLESTEIDFSGFKIKKSQLGPIKVGTNVTYF